MARVDDPDGVPGFSHLENELEDGRTLSPLSLSALPSNKYLLKKNDKDSWH